MDDDRHCTCDRYSQTGEGPDDDCPLHGTHEPSEFNEATYNAHAAADKLKRFVFAVENNPHRIDMMNATAIILDLALQQCGVLLESNGARRDVCGTCAVEKRGECTLLTHRHIGCTLHEPIGETRDHEPRWHCKCRQSNMPAYTTHCDGCGLPRIECEWTYPEGDVRHVKGVSDV